MRRALPLVLAFGLIAGADARQARWPITAAGQPAALEIRVAGDRAIRVTLAPLSAGALPASPALAHRRVYAPPALSLTSLAGPVEQVVGSLRVSVRADPLTVTVRTAAGATIQELTFAPDGTLAFRLDEAPVLGLGEGGPRPSRGTPWREAPVQFDRRGAYDEMQPRWQSDMYGSRNPAAVLMGTSGWGLYVASPWVEVDLRDAARGVFVPWDPPDGAEVPQNHDNQQQTLGKGKPPVDRIVPGLFDVFVLDAADPLAAMKDFAIITGPATMPPKWALGYMQSHRTLEDDAQIVGIVDTFREKRIPVDAVIYLGTGFAPRGWNTEQPSFEFNPKVFTRDPRAVLADLHARNVKVIVHMVPWDRDRLPTLYGSIPAAPDEVVGPGHLQPYWEQHVPLLDAGIDGFWPDEGDWFDLFERITRHRLYYEGHLFSRPDVRPWSLQRNGHPGIAQWGGWVWSGDTESAWKTLEAQIAVALNYSLSIGPYWGSDIGGFYPSRDYTGEMYARWFQFGAFSGSFRSHGRVWWLRLPWGWGGSERGPLEYGRDNAPPPPDSRQMILESELNNPRIEPVVRRYAELRYELMPYTYTLAWQAHHDGLPLMRALWLHYPEDAHARGVGDQFLWGRDLLIAPVYTGGATSRDVYLPAGTWYDWWTHEAVDGGRTVSRPVDLATMPIYARAGAIIPVDPIRQHTAEVVDGPTTLRVYPGADGAFTLYDDDGISQDYLQGRGSWIRITWDDAARQLTLEPGAPAGATNEVTARRFRVVLPGGEAREVGYAGGLVQVTLPR